MATQHIEYPLCPRHETVMVPHRFELWEISAVQETVSGFRCPNLICPIVYVEEAFHTLADGKLTPFTIEED